MPLDLFFKKLCAQFDALLALLGLQPLPDPVLCTLSHHKLQPILARAVYRRSDYVHDIAAIQLIPQGDDSAVRFCSNAFMADLRMNVVCKVYRRGTDREFLNVP